MIAMREKLRQRMVATLRENKITDERVLQAMANIPREAFLPPAMAAEAYDNSALPIGGEQTISQPLVVAEMSQALQLQAHHRVLEIGTGCGYQTAVLCKLCRRVFTIERIEELAISADKRLQSLRFTNYIPKRGDGSIGWVEQAPFDRIMVTAAAPSVPQPLLEQLEPNGILVAPIGEVAAGEQKLISYARQADGSFAETFLGYVRFVPLIGIAGVKTGAA